jgi:hypothetical protein
VNWSPVDGVKHVPVGEVDSFDTSDDAGGDEWDWEIRIVPDPPFRFILDRIVALMQAGSGGRGRASSARLRQTGDLWTPSMTGVRRRDTNWAPTALG